MMDELYLPTLRAFENDNCFTGSRGLLRYKLTPSVVKRTPREVDDEASSIRGEIWHGEFCFEKSKVEAERVFSMSEEGLYELREWLVKNV